MKNPPNIIRSLDDIPEPSPEDQKKSAEDYEELVAKLAEKFSGYSEIWRRVDEAIKVVGEAISTVTARVQPIIDGFAHLHDAKKALEPSGLLPHATTPWGRFNKSEPGLFAETAIQYYDKEWDNVEKEFHSIIDEWDVLPSAKKAFRDALVCHRAGLFRSAVLTLFPAVEAEFRSSFDKKVGDNAASLEELRKLVNEIPAGYILFHVAPLRLFELFNAHIYAKVKTSEAFNRFKDDPVPNRHAAIHGIIDYDTAVHSINALILADYIFFLITQLKKAAAAQQGSQDHEG
ncbi:hypothetical protein ACRDNQ_09030 [Palleronia sp. KMU-117]|uniref:hypothetical protein n=1 Tax=Palleronia sp. KMU-117 TaxID=3434108 RepID=UPI003D70C0C5